MNNPTPQATGKSCRVSVLPGIKRHNHTLYILLDKAIEYTIKIPFKDAISSLRTATVLTNSLDKLESERYESISVDLCA